MDRREQSIAVPIALMAAASGARTMTGLAAAARTGSAELSRATAALALFELMADKVPRIRNRTDAGPLVARVVAGAVIGASVAQMTGHDRPRAALAGALCAFVGAQLSFRFRRSLSRALPPFAAALVEDAVVLSVAATGSTLLSSRR